MVDTTFTINSKTSALVLIDLQKGITAVPTKPIPPAELLANANKLIEAFHANLALVIFVRVGFASDGKDMLRPQADEPMIRSGKMPEDWSSLAPELKKQEHDLLITKRQWGAFYGTELDLELRRRGITTIVLCGIATNLAVESTARAAFERAYNLVFASDAIASFSEEEHNFPITRIFPRIGRVRKTEEIIASLHTY